MVNIYSDTFSRLSIIKSNIFRNKIFKKYIVKTTTESSAKDTNEKSVRFLKNIPDEIT